MIMREANGAVRHTTGWLTLVSLARGRRGRRGRGHRRPTPLEMMVHLVPPLLETANGAAPELLEQHPMVHIQVTMHGIHGPAHGVPRNELVGAVPKRTARWLTRVTGFHPEGPGSIPGMGIQGMSLVSLSRINPAATRP